MTIHHDKFAYGKLASDREDIPEERIAEMLKALNEDKKEEKPEEEKQNG